MRTTPAFKEFLQKHGFKSLNAFGQQAGFGTDWNQMCLMSSGQYPSNHPRIPLIAKLSGVPVAAIEPFCQGAPLNDISLNRVNRALQRKAGNAVIVHPTKSKAAMKKRKLGRPPGSGVVLGTRNSLKRQSVDLRTAVRGMLTTTNVAIMKGDRYVPNIPTEALYLVLTDYAERRGIKTAVVLNPQFAELFD